MANSTEHDMVVSHPGISILHCSDLHFGRAFQPHLASRLLSSIRKLNPAAVVVSGDVTMRARRGQFEEAREFLSQIKVPLMVIPGNHDVPLYNLFMRMAKPFGNYTRYVADLVTNPILVGNVALYGINSVDPKRHQKGFFTPEHLHAVSRWMADLPSSTWRIIVTHQHFVAIPGLFRPGAIRNAEKVLAELSEGGVHGILSGHMHFKYLGSTRDFFPRLHRPIGLIHAGTATSARLRGHETLRGVEHANNFVLLEFSSDHFEAVSYDWNVEGDDFVRGDGLIYDREFYGDHPHHRSKR